jgi:hypothetical protein
MSAHHQVKSPLTISEMRNHAHALEKHVSFHKDVELIVASISRRRNEALRLFDLYRAGLGKRVDEAMKEIIDAEPEVDAQPVQLLEAPTAVPSGDPSINPKKSRRQSNHGNGPSTRGQSA